MTDIEIPLGKRTLKYRFFEMLPGLLSYGLILLPVALSFIHPLIASVFIVTYIIMWFVKAVGIAFRTIQGYNSLEKAQRIDWYKRLSDLEQPEQALNTYRKLAANEWLLDRHIQNLAVISKNQAAFPKPSDIYNVVIVTILNEPREVIAPTLETLFASRYDLDRLIVVIAYEERGAKSVHDVVHDLVKTYEGRCYSIMAVMHPKNIEGEVVGKGGNIVNAGKYLQKFIKGRGIPFENVLVTTLDCDNRPHPAYLAYATYEFIVNPKRHQCAYQPIGLFLNNIWDAPAPMRVLATGNSFWTIINSMRPYMLRNFASHSQSLASLQATNLWSVRTVVEDGHQYWRSYFAFDGDYEVRPIYVPIYQDAVLAETYVKTVKAQFLQLRRWAYGASDIAYVADKGFRSDRKVPLSGFLARFFRLLEGHVSWATAPFIITFGAWAPLIINPDASRSIVAHELPQIASNLQLIATVGLFIAVYLTFKMLPPRPRRYKRRRNFAMLLQWLIMPVVSICFGALSAFNAQTRLLFGRYLDKFDATTKVVKS